MKRNFVMETGLGPELAILRSVHFRLLGKPGCHIIRTLRAETLDQYGLSEAAETVRNMED